MRPNIQPSPHPQEGHGTGWFRDRIVSVLFGLPTPEQSRAESSALQPFFNRMCAPITFHADTIKTALSSHPGISESINDLYDPELDAQGLFDAVLRLNSKFGTSREYREGESQDAWFDLPNGARLHVQMYPESGNALSFSMIGSMIAPEKDSPVKA